MRKSELNRSRNRFGKFILIAAIFFAAYFLVFKFFTQISKPIVESSSIENLERTKVSDSNYKLLNNYLQKNQYGLWELYVEGSPYEIGLASGKLTKELIEIQEEAFVDQINSLIPSSFYLKFL